MYIYIYIYTIIYMQYIYIYIYVYKCYLYIHSGFKGRREYMAKVNIPKITYPNQHINTEKYKVVQEIM